MKIHTLKEAQEFLEQFANHSVFVFRDSKISMSGGGATHIILDGTYYQYSSGENWSDQQRTAIADPVRFVYRNRKDIAKGEFLV